MKNLISVLATLSCLLQLSPAYAEKKQEKLKDIENRVATEKARQHELKEKADKLERDMKGLKSDLIETTQSVQKQERSLQEIESKLAELEIQKKSLDDNLDKQRKSLSGLIIALERIRRLPPETLVARPGAPLETAQAATVMRSILPEINKRAEDLRTDLQTLSDLQSNLNEQKQNIENKAKKLKSEKDKMDRLVAERSDALKETKSRFNSKSLEIANLTKEAKDLRDLIKKLEKKNRTETRTATNSRSEKYNNGPVLGTGRLPVSGIIKTRYGETDDIGAISKGLVFSTRAGSVVVAPLGGIVRYAGDFRNYGQIVLIEHKNKFHSLVAGLGKVDTFVGQRVDAGEPIGSLSGESGRLYYELRYQGDPVNPSQKFSKLD